MPSLTQLCARLAAVAALSALVVAATGTTAHADPPRNWSGGTQADFGRVTWVHEGWYAGARGNWHVGDLTVEEDDDGIGGGITDWRCPAGETPPGPLVWPVPPTNCEVMGTTYVYQLDPWDLADFDHENNRLIIKGDFDEVDGTTMEVIGSVPIDVTIKGLGAPIVSKSYYQGDGGTLVDYEEDFTAAKAWGRFDGHRVSGPKVTQLTASTSFIIYGLSRTP
jgi:hypothetical protein